MNEHRRKDLILLSAVGVLIVLVFLPLQKLMTSKAKNKAETRETTEPVAGIEKPSSPTDELEIGASPPATGIPHAYLPLVKGSVWQYRVTGPEAFVKNEKWSMTLISAPKEETPGQLLVGFEGSKRTANIWLREGALRLGGMAFVAPLEFLDNIPRAVEGAFLPIQEQILTHALWVQSSERDITYRYKNKKGEQLEIPADARQTDRAHIRDEEIMTVPAGTFKSWRIAWLSRIEIKANDRPVLRNLTSVPFRSETMWIASGIGIVRRKIKYPAHPNAEIEFSLLSYHRPESN